MARLRRCPRKMAHLCAGGALQEIDTMNNSIVSLKYAQTKYEESNEALSAIKPENEGARGPTPPRPAPKKGDP